MITGCPVCQSELLDSFFQLDSLPVHGTRLWRESEGARDAPQAPMDMVCCQNCGLIFNRTFDPSLITYDGDYENALHFSGQFNAFASDLARRMVDDYGLRGKTVIEIGCGDAHFLSQLVEAGAGQGLGFDPSHRPGPKLIDGVRVITEFYSSAHVAVDADFICCRHVLEHIEDPVSFLTEVRAAIGPRAGTPIYFEVPSGASILREGCWPELMYEHFTYWTPAVLHRVFAQAGFEVTKVYESFNGQFLCLEGVAGEAQAIEPRDADLPQLIESFVRQTNESLARWSVEVEQMASGGTKTALWGAGSKGVAFLNLVSKADEIDVVIDVNPRKNGMFVPGTGQMIRVPEPASLGAVDTILLANGVYEAEVCRTLESMGLRPRVRSI